MGAGLTDGKLLIQKYTNSADTLDLVNISLVAFLATSQQRISKYGSTVVVGMIVNALQGHISFSHWKILEVLSYSPPVNYALCPRHCILPSHDLPVLSILPAVLELWVQNKRPSTQWNSHLLAPGPGP
jgi:hypothetical protein